MSLHPGGISSAVECILSWHRPEPVAECLILHEIPVDRTAQTGRPWKTAVYKKAKMKHVSFSIRINRKQNMVSIMMRWKAVTQTECFLFLSKNSHRTNMTYCISPFNRKLKCPTLEVEVVCWHWSEKHHKKRLPGCCRGFKTVSVQDLSGT